MLLKPTMISITFLAGFFLLEKFVVAGLHKKKKVIYSFFIELGYFIFFWSVVYMRFL